MSVSRLTNHKHKQGSNSLLYLPALAFMVFSVLMAEFAFANSRCLDFNINALANFVVSKNTAVCPSKSFPITIANNRGEMVDQMRHRTGF
jgi:hypothetical protein